MVEQNMEIESAQARPASQTGVQSLEISNAVARLHKQLIGRGPSNSRTTIDGDMVAVLLEGGYTVAEQTLEANDQQELVTATRAGLQESMRTALMAEVERVMGRDVLSFMSANDIQHNLQVEVFVLAPQQRP